VSNRYIRDVVIPAALHMLPGSMDSPEARAMLLAIGLQESKLTYRRQVGGPAHGFWQFEQGGGVVGVLTHAATKGILGGVLADMNQPATSSGCYDAIVDNDILACVFARLLLFTLPNKLPANTQPDEGWRQYVAAWRPGAPRPETWADNFNAAWNLIQGTTIA
jgi:hypothetical protein